MNRNPALRLALLLFAIGAVFYREAVMDDTFIHLQYARNLAERGELAFNVGEPSLGMTSPVWILLLALFGSSLMAAKLLSVAAGAVSVRPQEEVMRGTAPLISIAMSSNPFQTSCGSEAPE